jgi:DNA-binding response OmpR family regulator
MDRRDADVLIVEDDTSIAELYSLRLRMDGYTVHHATDATTAHVIFDQTRPAVVCMDTRLPGASGLEAATSFARQGATVVLLTNDQVSFESPPSGVALALLKSRTSPSELTAAIGELISRRGHAPRPAGK